MPYDETLLDEYADVIFQRLEDFNDYTLEVIGRHIKEIGSLSAYDQQALKNMADISGDMKKITEKLAEITKMNVEDIEKIYTQVVSDGLNTYKPLYDFKGIKFTPFQNNEIAKRLVRQLAMITDGEMINLTRTKALGFDKLGIVDGKVGVVGSYSLSEGLERVLGEAVTAVKAGTADFHTAMRKTIGELGGSGVKVIYGSGVNRSISAAVRQNVLWGVKKSIDLYDDELTKELELDGFEVDAHPGCRHTHEFMQGQMYAIGKGKTVNGKHYPSGDEALKALSEYGCLHYKTGVLLGISPSRYTKEELKKIHDETKKIIEFDGKKHTLYEWKQVQRRMERQTRNEMSVSKLYKASGDKLAAKQHKDRAMAYLNKYDELVKGVPGLEDRRDRMRVFVDSRRTKTIDKITSDFAAKKLTNGGKGGIIKNENIIIPRSVGASGRNYPVKLPDGNHTKLVEGTEISKVKVIMGYGTDIPLRDRFYLERDYGIAAEKWQKVRGEGIIVENGQKKKVELHWYEADGYRECMKVKEYLDEG